MVSHNHSFAYTLNSPALFLFPCAWLNYNPGNVQPSLLILCLHLCMYTWLEETYKFVPNLPNI